MLDDIADAIQASIGINIQVYSGKNADPVFQAAFHGKQNGRDQKLA
ncbi:MAG: hypothetical protein ACREEM_07395 [Blastocatellia bacterium]